MRNDTEVFSSTSGRTPAPPYLTRTPNMRVSKTQPLKELGIETSRYLLVTRLQKTSSNIFSHPCELPLSTKREKVLEVKHHLHPKSYFNLSFLSSEMMTPS